MSTSNNQKIQAQLNVLTGKIDAKIKDRRRGSRVWQGLRIGLGLAGLLLSGIGGAAILGSVAKDDPTLTVILGILTVGGGLCSAAVAFLKPEERFYANRFELAQWEALEAELGCVDINADGAKSKIQELGREYSALDIQGVQNRVRPVVPATAQPSEGF